MHRPGMALPARKRMMAAAAARSVLTETQAAAAQAPACDVTIVAHDIGPVRGMERQLSALAIGLRGLGHRVTVIARTCELPADSGVEFHRVRGPARPFLIAYPCFMVAGSLALRRWGRGAVHATGAIVLNRVDVIAVHYCHQVGTATPSRDNWIFRAHVNISGVLKRLGERICFRASRAAAFVCVSEGVAAEVREHYPAVAGRVLTIYNGIDTGNFAPGLRRDEARAMRIALGIDEEQLVAVFVGSEWERKGLGSLIEALTLAPGWTLIVAGEGDERRYRGLAGSAGVGEAVRWLGVSSDVAPIYELADALVLPSSYETFSLVSFEAAASGLPVLATPVNGVRELIADGENGFLISAEPAVIAERLRRLSADPSLRSRLGVAARESALAFGRERMLAEHEALYTRLAGAARMGEWPMSSERQ
jgi:glycosyltransferase involved in cell wall biosynthesis